MEQVDDTGRIRVSVEREAPRAYRPIEEARIRNRYGRSVLSAKYLLSSHAFQVHGSDGGAPMDADDLRRVAELFHELADDLDEREKNDESQ